VPEEFPQPGTVEGQEYTWLLINSSSLSAVNTSTAYLEISSQSNAACTVDVFALAAKTSDNS
jgi:hypothetical protein